MAGDWIKMRVGLINHPRVRRIAECLLTDAGFLAWAGFSNPVTEKSVTLRVTRYVTVTSLLRFWGYANEHAKGEKIAGVWPEDVDEVTGVPGFGEAIEAAGWVVFDREKGGMFMPNFEEHNVSAIERGSSAAERQRRYRERKKAEELAAQNALSGDGNSDVTRDVTVTHREEKRREEKKTIKTKITSSSGDDAGDGKVKPFDQFWAAYPRRVAKAEAQKAWGKIKPDAVLLALILKAIESQKEGADWRHEDGKYIPHPATWLRAGRWLDEVRPYVAPPLKLPPGWWDSKDGMAAAGLMLTPPLTPRQGEYPKEFAQRIRVAAGLVDPDGIGAAQAAPAIEPPAMYIPPAVPEGVQLTDEQREARRQETLEALGKMRQKMGVAGVPGEPVP